MCFPGTSGLSACPNFKYSWEWGQSQGTQAATAPCCSHATRWSRGSQFREHWTMTRPLPHPTEPEFALLSHSSGFRAKLIPKLPFSCCFQGCALGLPARGGARLPLSCPAWPITPATCIWIIPGAEQELGEGGSQAPACLLSTFLENRLGSSWHPAEPRAGSVLSSALGLLSGPATSPQQNCARVSASLGTAQERQRSALGGAQGAPVLSSLPASLPWPPRPLPVPGSPAKSSAVKAKSRLPDAVQPWPGAAGRWQPGSAGG